MNQVKTDLLVVTTRYLQHAVAADCRGQNPQWGIDVHFALGQLASAIQQGVQAAEHSMKIVGELNPDLQHTPVSERHMESSRGQLIKLGEQVHQLRADIRIACAKDDLDIEKIRQRGAEICADVEKVRHADNDFFQKALNTDLGTGE